MADRGSSVLWYGTFGSSTYDTEPSSWYFARDLQARRVLCPLYKREQASSSSSRTHDQNNDEPRFKSVRHSKQIKALVEAYPEIQPATSLLSSLLTVSEATTATSRWHEPLKGSQLAMISVYDKSRHDIYQVAAWVSGEACSDVSLAQMIKQKQGWGSTRDAWMESSRLSETSTIYGPGAPIRQVCSAQSVAGMAAMPLLAIRMHDTTKLLRVEVDAGRVSCHGLLDISQSITGGFEHSHVSFNPFFGKQFAIIDCSGAWEIWEFEGRYNNRTKRIYQHRSRLMASEGHTLGDGFSRIAWVGGPNNLVVATRSRLSLYDVSIQDDLGRPIGVGLEGYARWITEVKVIASRPDCLFVLTSAHVLVLRVECARNGIEHSILWKACHFANPQDLTLSMSMIDVADDVLVILRSLSVDYSLFFQVTLPRNNQDGLFAAGAFIFVPPKNSAETTSLDVYAQPISLGRSMRHLYEDHPFQSHLRLDLPILQLFHLSEGYTLETEIYCIAPSDDVTGRLPEPTWVGPSSRRHRQRIITDDEFSVNDDWSAQADQHALQQPPSDFVLGRRQMRIMRKPLHQSTDVSQAGMALESPEHSDGMDLLSILQRVREICISNDSLGGGVTSGLFDDNQHSILINDVDEVTELLLELLAAPGTEQSGRVDQDDELQITRTNLKKRSFASGMSDLTKGGLPSTLYDSLVWSWINPLTSDIPAEVRLAKDSLARQMASDLVLASHFLHVEQLPGDDDNAREDNNGREDDDESNTISARPRSDNMIDVMSKSSRAAPRDPSASATPSIITSTSRTSSIYEVSQYSLSKYITCTKPLPTSIPRPLQRVLRHWDLGADVTDYDWRSRSQHVKLQAEEEELDSQLTEKERARLKRTTERYIRRQRKEAAASQSQQVASSQVPEVMLSLSQPMPDRTRAESQSQSIPAATSQATPGRYGGRPVKKKRKQGF